MTRRRRDRQAMKRALLLKLPDSLLHLLFYRLVRVHNRLLVNHDLRRVRPRTANPGRDRRWVGLDNDPVCQAPISISMRKVEKENEECARQGPNGSTHPSSIVSSRQRMTQSKFSNTARFSTWFRNSKCTASMNAVSAE